MRAIGLNQYGGPDVLQQVELPDPQPGPGQVRVMVRAAGINPVDVMVREGALAPLFEGLEPPFVPGMDIAGTIDAVGDDVDPAMIKQPVVGVVDNRGSYGGYSEYVCLPAESVIPLPRGASFPEAASFLMNALTARNALDTLNLTPGSTLLVTGAAGAVGTYITALANDEGLRVVALAGKDDEAYVRSVGASDFIARGADTATRVRDTFPEGVDAVVDTAGLREAITPALSDGGTFIVLRPWTDADVGRGISVVFVNVRDRCTDQAAITRLGQQVESGLLPLRVAGVFLAREATAAHKKLAEGGLRGRLVLEFD